MLTRDIPETWQDLQTSVAAILAQCGFGVEIEKSIENVRGTVAIDVYAEEIMNGRRNQILCECKYWKSAVPQQIIHGFRTVIADIGANTGYIIGLNGFQSGAFEAVAQTNVKLVTWTQFQDEFEATWLKAYFTPTITEQLDSLITYTEPFAPTWFGNLSDADQRSMMELKRNQMPLGLLAMDFSRYPRIFTDIPYLALPLRNHLPQTHGLRDEILDASGYADLLGHLIRFGGEAIEKFRDYRERATGKRTG